MASTEESSSQAATEAQEKAQEKAESLSERASETLAEQKRTFADECLGIASALQMTASQLREQGQSSVADYAQRAADAADRLGHRIEERGISELMQELEDLGREQPMMLAGGAAAVGFALTRFSRSSSEGNGGK